MLRKILTNLGRLCILAAILVGPWTGGAYRFGLLRFCLEAICAGGVLALATLWTTPRRERQTNVYWGTIATSIPLALGLAFMAFQVYPLSAETLARFSPRVAELKSFLLPPDAPELKLSDLDKPDFDAEAFWRPREENGEIDLAATKERLGAEFPYGDDSSFDSAKALAADAAFENEFLPQDDPSRNVFGKTISILPVASLGRLVLYWGAALAFLASAILFNTNESRRFLWRVVALNGLAFALFCVACSANPAIRESELLTRWYGAPTRLAFGPYVCRNAAAGWLVLALAPAFGLAAIEFLKTVAKLEKERESTRRDEERVDAYERVAGLTQARARRREASRDEFDDEEDFEDEEPFDDGVLRRFRVPYWRKALGSAFDLLERRFVFWASVAGAILLAIFASLSRGATIAAVLAFAFVAIALLCRRGVGRYWPAFAAIAVVAAAGIVALDIREKVGERMSALVAEDENGEVDVDATGRMRNWRSAFETARDYRVFGSGVGTYALANVNNDVLQKKHYLFYFPENTLVQAYLETGIIGTSILIVAYAILAIVVLFALGARRGRETVAVGAGGLALLVGQFCSGLSDFAIVYLPGNLFLFAVLVGSCVGRRDVRFWEKINAALADKRRAAEGVRAASRAARWETVGAIVVSLFLVGSLACAPVAFAENARCVERARLLRESEFKDEDVYSYSVSTVEPEIAKLSEYLSRRPDDLEARERAIELETIRFRLGCLNSLKAENPGVPAERLWKLTTFDVCVGRTLKFRRLGFEVGADLIRSNPLVADSAPKLARELLAARRASPATPIFHLRLAQISALTTREPWTFAQNEIELCARRVSTTARFHTGLVFASAATLCDADVSPLWTQYWRRALDYSADWTKNFFTLTADAMASNGGESKLTDVYERILPETSNAARRAAESVASKRESPIFGAVKTVVERRFDSISEDERDFRYYFDRGIARKFLGDSQGAYDDLIAAEKLAPFESEILRSRAILLCERSSELGREDEAIETLEKYRATSRGRTDRNYSRWLKQAVSNRDKRDARAKAQARIEREREEEEKAKREREASGKRKPSALGNVWTPTFGLPEEPKSPESENESAPADSDAEADSASQPSEVAPDVELELDSGSASGAEPKAN